MDFYKLLCCFPSESSSTAAKAKSLSRKVSRKASLRAKARKLAMESPGVTTKQLLNCDEEKFDELIEAMKSEELIEAITVLQEEMGLEQFNFNRLSAMHSKMADQPSAECAELAMKLAESQSRLATLVARNMKCFNQETSLQNQELLSDLQGGEERPEQTSLNQSSPDRGSPEPEFDWLEPDKEEKQALTQEVHTSSFRMSTAPAQPAREPSPEPAAEQFIVLDRSDEYQSRPHDVDQLITVDHTEDSKSSPQAVDQLITVDRTEDSKSSPQAVDQLITLDPEPVYSKKVSSPPPPPQAVEQLITLDHVEVTESHTEEPSKARSSMEITIQSNTSAQPLENGHNTNSNIPDVSKPATTSWEVAGNRQSGSSTRSSTGSSANSYTVQSSHSEPEDSRVPDLPKSSIPTARIPDHPEVTNVVVTKSVVSQSRTEPEPEPVAWQAKGDRQSGSSTQSGSSVGSFTFHADTEIEDSKPDKPTTVSSSVFLTQSQPPPASRPSNAKPVVVATTKKEEPKPEKKTVHYAPIASTQAPKPTRSSQPQTKVVSQTITPTITKEPQLANGNHSNNTEESKPAPRVSVSETRRMFESGGGDKPANGQQRSFVRPQRANAPSKVVLRSTQSQNAPKSDNPTKITIGKTSSSISNSQPPAQYKTQQQITSNYNVKPSETKPTWQVGSVDGTHEQEGRVTTGRSGQLMTASGSKPGQPTRTVLRTQNNNNMGNHSGSKPAPVITTTKPSLTTTTTVTTTSKTNYPPIAKKPQSPILSTPPETPDSPTNAELARIAPAPRDDLMLASPMAAQTEGFTSDDKVKERVTLIQWDPKPLLEDLYQISLEPETDDRHVYINMEGYLEKLPINKRKATLLKTWKRRFFRAQEGTLYYFEIAENAADDENQNHNMSDKAGGYLQMVGGSVEDIGDGMLGLDDGRGRYMIVKPPTEREFGDWKRALESQTVEKTGAAHIKPVLTAQPHPSKKVIVIDLGSCNVRAGILGSQASLPQVFFPTVVATDKETGKRVFGFDAFKSDVRAKSNLAYPVRSSEKVDKFSLDFSVMPGLLGKIFQDLKVNPAQYWVMFSSPATLSDKMNEQFMDIFINQFQVQGVNIVNQTLLALYSYGARSGIVVDIGERLEIVPITDGYIVEQGSSRQPYGGKRITEAFNSTLTEKRYRFFTDASFNIVRLAMEQLSYVCKDFKAEVETYQKAPRSVRKSVDLAKYNMPKGSWTHVSNDLGRFQSPEGLFDMEVWGMDNPPLQKLVQKAVQACPMDMRREMWRSIYLSGGVTLMPGFMDRLQAELTKLVPPSIVVQVHAAPQRYHSAYIGACTLADMAVFKQSCISAEEWKKSGAPSLRKWHLF